MGNFGSKYSNNDYELVIKTSKELEHILEVHFHAKGRGLHEKISDASDQIPSDLIKSMRYLATIRNQLIHQHGFDHIPDRNRFIERFETSAKQLQQIIATRNRGFDSIQCIIS